MKDTLRDCQPEDRNCFAYLAWVSPFYFVTFVLIAQFVLVNVVVAVLMKHLEESNKEAKEDAEMDAEIALEMEKEKDAHQSPGSSECSMDDKDQCVGENLLSAETMSVLRMHSLPDDSYMFRPVRPASAPCPLEEVEAVPQHSMTVASVNSQPLKSRSLLQVPDVSVHAQSPPTFILPCFAPPTTSPSPRTLHRQVAVKLDSVESQSSEPQEKPNSALPVPHHSSSSSPLPSLLSAPFPLPPPRSSPSLLLPPPPSPRLPSRSASLRSRPRPPSAVSLLDPADEEVYHITSSARQRHRDMENSGQEGKRKAGRSHSLSPYTLPGFVCPDSSSPPPLPPSSSRSALSLLGAGLKGFSVDNQGFLEKPSSTSGGYADDQRRHSIEVCLPQAVITGVPAHFALDGTRSEKAAFPVRVQSERRGCTHRKKKMSPPCISIHPPSERDPTQTSSPPKLADCSMLLRRRTPSSDSNAQDAEAHRQMPAPLTPTRALPPSPSRPQTHTPPMTPTPPHISPNIFIQPHAPLLPIPPAQPRSPAARQSPHVGDYPPMSHFTFDPLQSRLMDGLSASMDADACSAPFDGKMASSAGFNANNQRTAP